MRTIIIVCCCLSFFFSCKNKKNLPSGILTSKKMEAVLWDIMRVDQYVTVHLLPKDSCLKKEEELKKWRDKVFAAQKISELDFQTSFHYYKAHPALLQLVMDSIAYQKKYEYNEPTMPVQNTGVVDSTAKENDSIPAKSVPQLMEAERRKHIPPTPVSGR